SPEQDRWTKFYSELYYHTEWPACSPDINTIGRFWHQLGHAVRARVTNTTTLADLRQIQFLHVAQCGRLLHCKE
uniref:Uncharacterized protein n=1 Tax=Mola mola TaxID=94237 RepID=A0A3Q4AR79_MOLML